jgi:NAD(P)-dependent dehydrogenase (short-subunit alcohol dehydrogenase family)
VEKYSLNKPYANPLQMPGRTIVVTGASSGIGRATAILLSNLGVRVVLVGRDAERLAQTKSALRTFENTEHDHIIEAIDLTDADRLPAWLSDLVSRTGPLAGLVHSAGNQITVPLRVMSEALFIRHMDVNVYAAGMLIKGFQAAGNHAPNGTSIVLLASTAARVGVPGNSVYAASKGALISLARALAMELAGKRIRINCIAPALVETEMFARYNAAITEEQRNRFRNAHPLGLGQPDDIANAVAFLLSDAARWITGTTLIIDGGYTVP